MPSILSGDLYNNQWYCLYIYESVPTKVLHIFRVASRSLQIPKSVNLASPNYELTKILSGLTSLCNYFLTSCKYANPFKVYEK